MALFLGTVFCSIDLEVSFVIVPYCFDYCSFVEQLEIQECDVSSFVLLSQNSFGYSWSFVFSFKFFNYSSSVGKAIDILIEIRLNLQIVLSNMVTLTMLILPRYIFPYVCVIFSFFHQGLIVFQVHIFYLLMHFTLCDVIINGTVSSISLCSHSSHPFPPQVL